MIRANLLPPSSDRVTAFGMSIEAGRLRAVFAGAAFALAVACGVAGVEGLRIARLASSVAAAETMLASRAPARAEAERVVLDIARYREVARETSLLRQSGSRAAAAVARIGNAVPRTVWLDAIERGDGGYTLTGGARSVDAIGTAMSAFGSAVPDARADLVTLDAPPSGARTLRFSARIASIASPSP